MSITDNVKVSVCIITIFLSMLLCFFSVNDLALAHDAKNPGLNKWFDELRSGNGPCCSDADGTALSDVEWESKDGKYRVNLKGTWFDVPAEAVLTIPNMAGTTMVWPVYYGDQLVSIRCFIPGSMT